MMQISENRTLMLVDDHTLVTSFQKLNDEEPVKIIVETFTKYSLRFRPVMDLHRYAYVYILGLNVKWISYYFLFVASITSFLLHLTLKLEGLRKKESYITTLVLLFGMQGVIWWNFDSSENIGVFFLCLVMYIGKSMKESETIVRDFLFILLTLLMVLSKETFIFIIPFLMIEFSKSKKNRILLFIIFVVGIVFLTTMIGNTFIYAGIDKETLSIRKIITVIVQFGLRGYGFPLLILLIYLLNKNRKNIVDFILINCESISIIVFCILPFIVVYTKSGLNVGRYLIPLVIPVFYVIKKLLLQTEDGKNIKKFIVAIALSLFGYHSLKFVQIQNDFKKENIFLSKFYNSICNEDNNLLVIVNPIVDFERAGAFMIYANSEWVLKKNIKMMELHSENEEKITDLVKAFREINRTNLVELNKSEMQKYNKWIVLNGFTLNTLQESSFLTKSYTVNKIGSYSLISFAKNQNE